MMIEIRKYIFVVAPAVASVIRGKTPMKLEQSLQTYI